MERNISENLIVLLDQICDRANDTPVFWREFYRWCIISYREDREKRFSVSKLGSFLLDRNVKNTKEIIVAYIHILYSLALFEGKDIYGEGFVI